MRVHSHDQHAEVADFLPDDKTLRVYRRSSAPNRSTPVRGHFSRTFNRTLAVLYREDGVLRFFLEGSGVIDLSAGITASWQMVTRNKAQLSFDSEAALETTVPLEIVYRSQYDRITAQIAAVQGTSREDWDFGLYISNVLKDAERRERIYRDDPAPE